MRETKLDSNWCANEKVFVPYTIVEILSERTEFGKEIEGKFFFGNATFYSVKLDDLFYMVK